MKRKDKYWEVEGWNDPAVIAVAHVCQPTESLALQRFAALEGEEFAHVEAREMTWDEYAEFIN